MPFLVVQILQLQVEPVDFLARLCRRLLCVPHFEDGIAVQLAQVPEVGVEQALLLRHIKLDFDRRCLRGGDGVGFDQVDQVHALLAGVKGGGQD